MSWNGISAPNFRYISAILTVFVATVQSGFCLGTAFSTDHVTGSSCDLSCDILTHIPVGPVYPKDRT